MSSNFSSLIWTAQTTLPPTVVPDGSGRNRVRNGISFHPWWLSDGKMRLKMFLWHGERRLSLSWSLISRQTPVLFQRPADSESRSLFLSFFQTSFCPAEALFTDEILLDVLNGSCPNQTGSAAERVWRAEVTQVSGPSCRTAGPLSFKCWFQLLVCDLHLFQSHQEMRSCPYIRMSRAGTQDEERAPRWRSWKVI